MIRPSVLGFACLAAALPLVVGAEVAGPKLAEAEIAAFSERVQTCWVPPSEDRGQSVDVTVAFTMDPTGLPDPGSFRIVGDGEPDPLRQQSFEAAWRAVMRCAADGYALPPERYEAWHEIEMTFTPAGIGVQE